MSNNNNNPNQVQHHQNNQQQKLLILNPSPRNIPHFETKVKLLNSKYDFYRVKYDFDERHAYQQGWDFFLNTPQGKKYTHMAILPDDLLIEVHQVDKLLSDLEKNPNIDVISGVCNWSCINRKFYNTLALIPIDNRGAVPMFKNIGKYSFYSLLNKEKYKNEPKGIKRVLFAAFSFTIISRKVVEKFGVVPIEPRGEIIDGMGLDTVFYNNCFRSGIPCYADYDVLLLHIKDMEKNNDLTHMIEYAEEHNINTEVIKRPEFKQENIFLKAGSIS